MDKHIRLLDFVAAKADQLVERGFGIAHASFGTASNGVATRCHRW
ncbi:MAG: hypothetical protein QM760_12650 [Nibricoccus sp.]